MDSSITLVNPGSPTSYFLNAADPKNIIVYAHPSDPLYQIEMEAGQIKIIDAHHPSRVLAIIHHKGLRPDTLSFPARGEKSVISTQKWLKKTKLPDGTVVHVMDTENGSYMWKVHSSFCQKIYQYGDLETEVACCRWQHAHGKPALVLEYGAEPLRDVIIIGYFVQRHKITMEERAIDVFVGPW
ncbi:hypothetical protein F5J12DRAFT_824527 [Pisolithus orientalis]|uniref:uncharacterized protein n=1 Tax=Pisolithus orientalis TaxID=936130 RepID=UPI00222545BF|nr:uncharacterized protein F5J12DRAFT_824527 [Pisolithus orientalis]KAI6009608.1 hypothetical protein F5J12DRAFT_824527 [Pisolithus orientalis]